MTVIFTRQSHERTALLRKEFKHEKATKLFLEYLYKAGYINPHQFSMDRISKGKLPRGFDIHHIVPLSGGGTNDLSNLCLIEKSLHRFLNRHCFDPALKNIHLGETVEINVPDLLPVALHKEYQSFIQETLSKQNKESGFKKILQKTLQKLPLFSHWLK